jgi:hypothetical protein
MEGKVFVNAAKSSDEVIFERADCTFGGVSSMEAWRHELIVDICLVQEFFERG